MFAAHGLTGARIDEIAARTRTSKRMIYYYFGDKGGLHAAASEAAYAEVREAEAKVDLEGLRPTEALARLVEFTFAHHHANPDFIRMVRIENTHNAAFLKRSEVIRGLNAAAIARLAGIISGGQARGCMRAGLDPVRLHWQISALSFFNVSNKPTFSALFGSSLFAGDGQARRRDGAVKRILDHARNPERQTG